MKILVAGAAGYLGQNLIKVLHEKGHNVIGLDVRASALEPHKSFLAAAVGADMTRPSDLQGKCDGIDVVISTVGLEFPRKNLSYWDVDYQANLNLLREAEQAGVEKFMYISVIHADREINVPPILAAKRAFEKELMRSTLKWVIFRPTGYFKDIVNIFLKMAQKGKVRIVGDGRVKSNPLHPLDFSEFITSRLGTVNEIKEVGGPEVFSYNELGKAAFEIVGVKPRFSYMTPKGFMKFAKIMKFFKPLLFPVLQFSLWCMTNDMVAPKTGTRRIIDTLKESA